MGLGQIAQLKNTKSSFWPKSTKPKRLFWFKDQSGSLKDQHNSPQSSKTQHTLAHNSSLLCGITTLYKKGVSLAHRALPYSPLHHSLLYYDSLHSLLYSTHFCTDVPSIIYINRGVSLIFK